VSFHEDVVKAGIGTAALRSYDGEFLLPTRQAIEAAASSLWPRTPRDERLTLVNAPGANAYPLINYEYAVVAKKQPSPETAAALRSFLLWAIAPDETNAQYLANANFIPLPAHLGAQPRPDRRDKVGALSARARARKGRKKTGLLAKARL
jgi:phosphate transport system substrate-binding protein